MDQPTQRPSWLLPSIERQLIKTAVHRPIAIFALRHPSNLMLYRLSFYEYFFKSSFVIIDSYPKGLRMKFIMDRPPSAVVLLLFYREIVAHQFIMRT